MNKHVKANKKAAVKPNKKEYVKTTNKVISVTTLDVETGEIKDLMTHDPDLHRLVNKKSEDALKKHLERAKEKESGWRIATKHWVANFHDGLETIDIKMDDITGGIALTLSMYQELDSNGVFKIDGEYMWKQDIDTIIGMKEKASRRHLKNLQELGVLNWDREKHNVYTMNPQFHFMGNFPDDQKGKEFTKIFKESMKEVLPKLSLGARGILYKFLRKVHVQNYFLTFEPNFDLRKQMDKSFFDNLEKRTLKEPEYIGIHDIVELYGNGKSKRMLEKYLSELDDVNILQKFGRGRNSKYQVNPKFISKQDIYCPYAISTIYNFEQRIKKQGKKLTKNLTVQFPNVNLKNIIKNGYQIAYQFGVIFDI
jgi:hypothetical protein